MPIALSAVEGCAQSSRSNVKMGIASLHPSYNIQSEGDGKPVLSEVEGSILRAPRLWSFE